MEKELRKIEKEFRKRVKNSKELKNAYLLVHSNKHDIHLKLAEGFTGSMAAHPDQPLYMASVGKLFTSTLIAILYENGELSFNDSIGKFLEPQVMKGLHVYRGKEYSGKIQMRHLLNHTSGLPDNFWPLLDSAIKDPEIIMSPQELIEWTKSHAKPAFAPGKGFKYTDTNYHLLGLIVEKITGMSFHDALRFYFFEPLGMKNSWMLHASKPSVASIYPMADFFHKKHRLNDNKRFAALDYAGGGVVATGEDLLRFMKALVKCQIVTPETLEKMKIDKARFGMGIDYGYGIWQFKTVPVLMPSSLNCWGVAGATGAFMFFHPESESWIIGNFNQTSWNRNALKFMLLKVIKNIPR